LTFHVGVTFGFGLTFLVGVTFGSADEIYTRPAKGCEAYGIDYWRSEELLSFFFFFITLKPRVE